MARKPFHFLILLVITVLYVSLAFGDDALKNLVNEKKYSEAVKYADEKLPVKARTVEEWILIAQANEKNGGTNEKVLSCYNAAMKVMPSDPRVHAGLGSINLKMKKYDESLKYYQRSYLLERSGHAAEGIAVVAAKLKNWDKARDAAESAVKLDSSLVESRIILENLYWKDKNYEMAADQLTHIVKSKSGVVAYWNKLASCYINLKKLDKLATVDPQIINLDKKNIESRRRHAEYTIKNGDLETAYTLFKELAVLTPNDAKVFKHLFTTALKKDLKSDAVLYLKNFLALDSLNAIPYVKLGNLQYADKKNDEALSSYRKAFKIDSKVKDLYKNYVPLVLSKKLDKEAIKVINGAIAAGESDEKMIKAIADIYKNQKQYTNATVNYTKVLDANPQNIEVLKSLAFCQGKAGKTTNAISTYEQIILMDTGAKGEYKALGNLKMKLNKNVDAIKNYKTYLQKSENDNGVALIVGMHEYKKKNYKDAIAFLTQVKDRKLQDVKYLLALSGSYFEVKDYVNAAKFYAQIESKKVSVKILAKILKPLGESYEQINETDKAANAFSNYTKLAGVKDADASYKKAFLIENKAPDIAEKIYLANIKRFATDNRNFLRLGIMYSADKTKQHSAASMLFKASKLDPKNADVLAQLGGIYGGLKKESSELSTYKKLLALDPQNVIANKRVGTILLKKKKYAASIINLEMVATLEPKNVNVLTMLSEGYMKTKRADKAAELLTKACSLKPDNVKIRLDLLVALEAIGKKSAIALEKEKLAELDKKNIKNNKKDIAAHKRLADYTYAKNDFTTAYPVLKTLSKLTPKDKDVFKRLHEISLRNGNKSEAISYLKQFIALDKRNAKANKALGLLLHAQNDMNGALIAFRATFKIDSMVTGYFLKYGTIVLDKKLVDEAIKVFNAAIKSGETDKMTFLILGDLYKSKKSYKSAIQNYKKASDDDPQNTAILTSMGKCQAKLGLNSAAILTYDQVVMLNASAVDEHKALGELKMKIGKKEEAIKAYKNYLAKNSSDEKIAKTVGNYEYDKKNYKEAIKYLSMVKTSGKGVGVIQSLATAYYSEKNYAKAAEFFTAVKSKTTSVAILKTILKPLAISFEKIKKISDAAKVYSEYTKIKGVVDADASFKKAFLIESSDNTSAISTYTSNTKLFPKDGRNFERLGFIYAKDKSSQNKSAAMLSKASLLDPKNVEILKTLANVYHNAKNRSKELTTYRKLLKLEPQDVTANRRVGIITHLKKDYSNAIINLEMALTMAPKDVDVMLYLAEGYMKTKRPEKAIELLVKAKTIKVNDPEIGNLLYKLYKKTGKEKQAESEIKELIALTKDNTLRTTYARDLIKKKRLEEASALVKEIKSSDPSNLDGLMLDGNILQAQNKLDEAIEAYKMISFVNDKYAPALYERGNVYFAQKKNNRAKDYYKRSIAVSADFALGYLGLAKVAKAQNNSAEMKKMLAKALSLDPDDEDIKSFK